jgi:hypothetical protein
MLDAESKPRLVVSLGIIACLFGFFLRLYFYGVNRPLWIDEARLALNLVNRSFLGLLKPLDFGQGAPIGFLVLQKAAVSALGSTEYSLRLIPLLAGLVSVPLMYAVARQYGGQWVALLTLGLFAVSPTLIYYSSELKQYSTDVLAALLLLLIAPKCLDDKAGPNTLLALGLAGCLAMWISHPSFFVFVGIFLTLSLAFAVRRDWHRLLWLMGVGGAWAVNLSLIYLVNLRFLESNSYLLGFWSGYFAPLPPWSSFAWYSHAFVDMLRTPAALPANAVIVGLLIAGVISFAFRRWELMLVLIAPFLLTLLASALRRYPFGERLLLFLVPFLLLLLAEGVHRVWMVLRRVNRPIAGLVSACLVVYLMYGPLAIAYKNLQSPPLREDIRPVMAYLSENRLSTDLIYVYYGAQPAFQFYAPLYGFARSDYVVGLEARNDPSRYLAEVDKMKGSRRAWFVFSHNCGWCIMDEQNAILKHLDAIGVKRAEAASYGASTYLYDLGRSP